MLKLQTIIKKQKWKIPGISFNGKKTPLLKIYFSNQINYLSKSDFHKSLTHQGFYQLIDLKESILNSNEFSFELCSFLRILNLQINRLKDSAYSLASINNVDINKNHNELTKLYQRIKYDLIRIKRIESLETKKFHIHENLANYLDTKLDSIAVRIHQIHFEESLPKIDYPNIYMYEPKDWCKIIENKALSCEDPYNTTLKIRLQLDRIENESIHLHRIKIEKGKDKFYNGIKKESQIISKENYINAINNLINLLPDIIEKNKREEKIRRLKCSVTIQNKAKFKKCIKFMVDRNLMQFDYSNINWLIFSISYNNRLNFENELPKYSIYVDTQQSLHDVRMIFQYMLSNDYIKYEVANQLNDLLCELISSPARGNSFASWKNNISNSIDKMRTINFKNANLNFIDFQSFIVD